jgi:hypothetical protein
MSIVTRHLNSYALNLRDVPAFSINAGSWEQKKEIPRYLKSIFRGFSPNIALFCVCGKSQGVFTWLF